MEDSLHGPYIDIQKYVDQAVSRFEFVAYSVLILFDLTVAELKFVSLFELAFVSFHPVWLNRLYQIYFPLDNQVILLGRVLLFLRVLGQHVNLTEGCIDITKIYFTFDDGFGVLFNQLMLILSQKSPCLLIVLRSQFVKGRNVFFQFLDIVQEFHRLLVRILSFHFLDYLLILLNLVLVGCSQTVVANSQTLIDRFRNKLSL